MRIPNATYRIQFNPKFGFQAARRILNYLADLGVSDLYASPVFKAKKGSQHGYDIVDHNQLNLELGTEEEFELLAEDARRAGVNWLQDVVPNHMAFTHENAPLMDVLENGPSSKYYHYFDIEWNHPYEAIRGRLLTPFLGEFFGDALDKGEIKLRYDDAGLSFWYYDRFFPARIETYAKVFLPRLDELKAILGEEHADFIKMHGLFVVAKTDRVAAGQDAEEYYNQLRFIKEILCELYRQNPEIRRYMNRQIEIVNGGGNGPDSLGSLDTLLAEQFFRLSFWKVADEELNYRRFFNINELISVRVEENEVFEHAHQLVFKLLAENQIQGLRVDHIDGLCDPGRYLLKIREKARDAYVVVEKILAADEILPSWWPVQGTTGYDFLNRLNELFVRRNAKRAFDRLYGAYALDRSPYPEQVVEKKRQIIHTHMAGDVDNLAHLTKNIFSRYRHGGDLTLYGLRRAIVEVMAHFPVYRTYIDPEHARAADQETIRSAIQRAVKTSPELIYELRFIERFLLLRFEDYFTEEDKQPWYCFVMRFQQFTAPLMAKGFEDTFLYTYNRLISLNEVGGGPERFGLTPEQFNAFLIRRQEAWPFSLNATATHDTKRGEDVRARINVLTEIPKEWGENVRRWMKLNSRKRCQSGNCKVPDRNDEYFLYQTLVGAYPAVENEATEFKSRLKEYITKAVREAKVHTAWVKPDTDYERDYLAFIDKLLNPAASNMFLKEFLPFQRKVAFYGYFNSLAQVLVKCAAPGVPDIYQGCELWDFHLVDPDNRRPVDFELRQDTLAEIHDRARNDLPGLLAALLAHPEDGRVKLFLLHRLLQMRKRQAQTFQRGRMIPLDASGKFRDNVYAFARNWGGAWLVAVAPRFLTGVIKEGQLPLGPAVWEDTALIMPDNVPGAWSDAVTGRTLKDSRTLPLGEVLRQFPVALLTGAENR